MFGDTIVGYYAAERLGGHLLMVSIAILELQTVL